MRADHEREFVEYLAGRMTALHRAAYLLCGDSHRADDIVQATATALYRHWRRARAAEHIDAYAHRILVRKWLDEKRLGWARVHLMASMPEPAATGRAEVPSTGVEDRDALRTALANLPRAQRTVLVLRYACDMSVADVATVLRCSDSNVQKHAARGLAALRQTLTLGGDTGPAAGAKPDAAGAERRSG